MDDIFKDIYKKRCSLAVSALLANDFDAFFVDNAQEAFDKAMTLIPEGATIGVGGSNTIRELGLVEALENRGHVVYHHWKKDLTPEQKNIVRKKQLSSDVFLTSSNAVTLNGQLVNVDGTGNRVAAMVFGPQKVIIVVGATKIVDTLDDALSRIKSTAAPLNGRRLGYKTPCALNGKCTDCKTNDRMCNVTVIMDRRPRLTDITVMLVGEELGY